MGRDRAQGGQHAQPFGAGDDHIEDKDDFKEQEEDAAEDLSAGNGAEAHHQVGGLGLPVPLGKGRNNVLGLVGDPKPDVLEKATDGKDQIQQLSGNRREKAFQLVEELLPL